MPDNNRQHRRIDKIINIQYCVAGELSHKWDMSIVENISAGGVRFIAPSDLKLKDKIIHLRIKLPQLAPHLMEIEAMVVHVNPRSNSTYADVKAKFINLSEISKQHLIVIEKMIENHEIKNVKKF